VLKKKNILKSQYTKKKVKFSNFKVNKLIIQIKKNYKHPINFMVLFIGKYSKKYFFIVMKNLIIDFKI
jgi:hypothetical protein